MSVVRVVAYVGFVLVVVLGLDAWLLVLQLAVFLYEALVVGPLTWGPPRLWLTSLDILVHLAVVVVHGWAVVLSAGAVATLGEWIDRREARGSWLALYLAPPVVAGVSGLAVILVAEYLARPALSAPTAVVLVQLGAASLLGWVPLWIRRTSVLMLFAAVGGVYWATLPITAPQAARQFALASDAVQDWLRPPPQPVHGLQIQPIPASSGRAEDLCSMCD